MDTDAFNIFDELEKWSKRLTPWQQCALKYLVAKEQLGDNDYKEIFSEFMYGNMLWKREGEFKKYSLELPEQKVSVDNSTVVIQKMLDVNGVNALVPGQELHFGQNVTVIYGSNASGKSGYARILKSACFTRSKQLEILGNVNLPPDKRGRPTACVDLADGTKIKFEHGKPCPTLRDNFSVFDGSCIRVHTDDKNRFTITPYLFDVFPRLVQVCGKIESMLSEEINKKRPDIAQFIIQGESSKVATALNSLSYQSNLKELNAWAEYGEKDEARAVKVARKLVELKSTNHGELLKRRAREKDDLTVLENKLNAITIALHPDCLTEIKECIEENQTLTALVAASSAAQFQSEPVQPVGSTAWRSLVQAAIVFSAEAYPDKGFPATLEEARCVLCQQSLANDAQERLQKFFTFINSDTESKLKAASNKLANKRSHLDKLDLSFFDTESVQRRTLGEQDDLTFKSVEKLVSGYKATKKELISNIDNMAWNNIDVLNDTVSMSLIKLRKNIEAAIDELKIQDTGKVIQHLEDELLLLKHREFLSKSYPKIERAVESLRWVDKAQKLRPISHRYVTVKQKALMKDLVAKGFESEFQLNCDAMKLVVPLQFKLSGAEGETNRKLEYESDSGSNVQPSRVLSEGEQTAVALADFLAEVKLNNTGGGIVFDDPVTSLDHMRKEAIAKRLIEEAKKRQVVIFSHDIVFTHHLVNAAVSADVPLLAQTISQGKKGPGCIGLESFPHPHYEKQARLHAQQCLVDAREATGSDRKILLEKGCAKLRTAYEHYIQNVLFRDVIGRWRENIKYTLSQVYFDEDIANRVQERMESLSRYIDAHSHTAEFSEVPLTIEILEDEIKLFSKIRKDYTERCKKWELGKPTTKSVLS